MCLKPKPTFSALCAWLSCQGLFLVMLGRLTVGEPKAGPGQRRRQMPALPPSQSHWLFSPVAGDPRDPVGRLLCPQALQANKQPATHPPLGLGTQPHGQTAGPSSPSPDDSAVTDSAVTHGACFQLGPTKCIAGSYTAQPSGY